MTNNALLHRQVHPSWVQEGEPTSQAFRPTPKDGCELSVYDGAQMSAEDSWIHYTTHNPNGSVAVLSVTREECASAGTTATVDGVPYAEHAYIDFSSLDTSGKIKAASKILRGLAWSRGWQFGPVELR